MANRDTDYRVVSPPAITGGVGKSPLRLRVLGVAALAASLGGCVHQDEAYEADYDPTPPAPPQVTVSRDVVIGEDTEDDGDGAEAPPPASTRNDLVWSKVPLVAVDRPKFFLLGAGLGALGHIDLNPCRDHGLSSGYVHMHLTFHAMTGRVVRAAIETPVAPPAEALSCIGEQVEATRVPQFEGGDVNLSRSFYVN
jgi:hypothetical protein